MKSKLSYPLGYGGPLTVAFIKGITLSDENLNDINQCILNTREFIFNLSLVG